jgi:hypothetical protein
MIDGAATMLDAESGAAWTRACRCCEEPRPGFASAPGERRAQHQLQRAPTFVTNLTRGARQGGSEQQGRPGRRARKAPHRVAVSRVAAGTMRAQAIQRCFVGSRRLSRALYIPLQRGVHSARYSGGCTLRVCHARPLSSQRAASNEAAVARTLYIYSDMYAAHLRTGIVR